MSRVVEEGEDGGFAQVSGVRFVYDGKRAPGSRIVSATVGKNKLDNKKSYKLATVSYLADGNEGYTMLKGKPDLTASGMSKFDVDLMLEKIKKTRVSPQTDGRITRRDGN